MTKNEAAKNEFGSLAVRQNNAVEAFISYAMETAALTEEQALTVVARYRKDKLCKFDAVSGRYLVKHGAFLDADVLRRAAGIEE